MMSRAAVATGFGIGTDDHTNDDFLDTAKDLRPTKVIEFSWSLDHETVSALASEKEVSYYPKSVIVSKAMVLLSVALLVSFFIFEISAAFLVVSLWLAIVGFGMLKTIRKATESIIEKSSKK